MVDRIVPATTDADRTAVSSRLGVEDAWPVVTEPFTQWVIEDRFPAGRPRFEEAGAELVADVAPYELMKLRLLNGSHSTLAYLGYLAGYETISDAMGDGNFARLVAALMTEEVAPTLTVPSDANLPNYMSALQRALPQPGAQAPHLADRHGRLAEAAAALSGHDPRPPRHRRAVRRASPSASLAGCAT